MRRPASWAILSRRGTLRRSMLRRVAELRSLPFPGCWSRGPTCAGAARRQWRTRRRFDTIRPASRATRQSGESGNRARSRRDAVPSLIERMCPMGKTLTFQLPAQSPAPEDRDPAPRARRGAVVVDRQRWLEEQALLQLEPWWQEYFRRHPLEKSAASQSETPAPLSHSAPRANAPLARAKSMSVSTLSARRARLLPFREADDGLVRRYRAWRSAWSLRPQTTSLAEPVVLTQWRERRCWQRYGQWRRRMLALQRTYPPPRNDAG